jgi:hypothetical protein
LAQRLAHFLHTEGVIGSIPISPTVITARFCRAFFVSIPFHATSSNKNASIDAPAKTAIDENRFTTLHKNCR